MKMLLTSMGIVGIRENGVKVDAYLNPDNGFIDKVKSLTSEYTKFVFIASDKMDHESNDNSCKINLLAFEKEGITFNTSVVIDSRNSDNLEYELANANVIFLQGGDVVLQNQFFKEIGLKEVLENLGLIDTALIIGQSAGSMNMATKYYVYPEDESQLNYPKFVEGLGYMDYALIPHFNLDTGNNFLFFDIDLMNDYLLPDSKIMPLYAMLDGTYLEVTDKATYMCGESYLIKDGVITKLCDNNESIILN